MPGAHVIEAGSLAAAVRAAETAEVLRLILLDLNMPGAVGYSGIALLHAERPDVPILVVSSADAADVAAEVRDFGAVGFLRKDSDLATIDHTLATALGAEHGRAQTANTVEEARRNVASLTSAQLKVLIAVLEGKLNKQIAHELAISEATVKAHMTAIMRKLDVRNRTQAALAARALGLRAPDG